MNRSSTLSAEIPPFPGFEDFAGRIWLNTAHQGVLPLVSAAEAREAIDWKTKPFELTQSRFDDVPQRLRTALGKLVGVDPAEIILANSASYGLHLIANNYAWRDGDEIIVTEGDFPSNILPWLHAERRYGARVVRVSPRVHVLSPDELRNALTPRTRVVCATWVHSLSGFVTDIAALAEICRKRDIVLFVNASQGLGARKLDPKASGIHGFTCAGFKWLCGPYGTGFCWIEPTLREKLRPAKAYWLAAQTAEALGKAYEPVMLRDGLGARAFDIFGTANFFNSKPFAASIEYLLGLGLDRIAAHDQALVDEFLAGLNSKIFEVLSPRSAGAGRSTLIFISHRDRSRNQSIHTALADAAIYAAFRNGTLRFSPHLYNSSPDIGRALETLNRSA